MLKVLVVEDHALVREGLLATLCGLGAETQTIGVPDANEAIGVLEKEDVDMMILDLMLPGTKGQTFLPLVRRRFPTVPVVVLSALDDADTVSKVMKAGASGFVSKAGSSNELLDALRAVLSGEIYLPQKLQELASRSGIGPGRRQAAGPALRPHRGAGAGPRIAGRRPQQPPDRRTAGADGRHSENPRLGHHESHGRQQSRRGGADWPAASGGQTDPLIQSELFPQGFPPWRRGVDAPPPDMAEAADGVGQFRQR
jgi:DNA-binding NarL/FixJ family response regulator